VRGIIAAEFAVNGAAMVDSRAALATELAPADTDSRDQIARDVTSVTAERDRVTISTSGSPSGPDRSALETWRDTTLDTVSRLGDREPLTPQQIATTAVGLGDVRVRDTALWDLMQPGVDRDAVASNLASVVRLAPDGHVAPAATVLAICHWTSGDGARANVALEHALADDPDYSLAGLVGASLRSGLPPKAWSDALAGLSRDVCRHGEPPATPSPAPAPSGRPRASVRPPSPGLT
jgi:hypothetical protein